MPKPKVIIVGKLPPPYIGPAIATQIILNSSLKENFELIHLDTTVNKSIDGFGKGGLGKITANFLIYIRLLRLLSKQKIDLVHIPISQTTLGFLKDSLFILIAALFSTKFILQLRGSNFKNWMKSSGIFTKSYVRFCFNLSDGMIVLGENLRYLFEDYFTQEKIFVVPNGCDTSIPESDLKSNKVQLLYFANLLPTKGIREVLEALVLLENNSINSYFLTAVGAWNNDLYKSECIDLVEKNLLNVSFKPPMSGDAKWQTFANADIFIFTPNGPEGHPWVIVEALSASLPIITTNQGAIIESVLDNVNGYIVSNRSPKQIAQKLEILITDNSLRTAMARQSLDQYKLKFTENKMVKKLTSTYQKVLNTNV